MNAINAGPADFFREVKATSMAMNLIYYNLIKGKKAQWLCDAKKVHIMSYTPDLAKGTAIFGTTPVAYNQIWNLPTDSKKITGEGWVSLFAKEMKVSNKYQVMPNWLLTQVANSQIQNAPKWPIFDYLSTKCIYFERAINLNNL